MARRTLIIRALGLLASVGVAVTASLRGWGADLMAWIAAAGFLLVAWTFAKTLRRGAEPLITSYCRLDYGVVPAECLGYTRRLTQLWALLMSALAIEAVAIQLSGHATTWLGPAGTINLAVLVAVFLGEHWLRRLLHPDLPASPLRTGRIMLRWFLVRG